MQPIHGLDRTKKAYSSTTKNFHPVPNFRTSYFDKFRKIIKKGNTDTIKQAQQRRQSAQLKIQSKLNSQNKLEKLVLKNKKKLQDRFEKYRSKDIDQQAFRSKQHREIRLSSKLETQIHVRERKNRRNTQLYSNFNTIKARVTTPQVTSFQRISHKVKEQFINYQQFAIIGRNMENQQAYDHIWEKMIIKQTLGTGSYGVVKLGQMKDKTYAVKIYQKYKLIDLKKRKRVYLQISILKLLPSHPNVICLYEALEDKRQIHMLFEEISGAKTLLQQFKENFLRIPLQMIKKVFYQIVKGVAHLHLHQISHRDIKPQNVLIYRNKEDELGIKIIDFGFATKMKKTDLQCGTPNFMAPQIFEKFKKHEPQKSDIWALGITLFYLCEGRYPFKGFDQRSLMKIIKQGKYQAQKTTEPAILQIIRNCLKMNPQQRWNTEQILQSSWFKKS